MIKFEDDRVNHAQRRVPGSALGLRELPGGDGASEEEEEASRKRRSFRGSSLRTPCSESGFHLVCKSPFSLHPCPVTRA